MDRTLPRLVTRRRATTEARHIVIARLAAGWRSFRPHPVTRESFVDELCMSLASMGANVGAIHTDQWHAVIVEGVNTDGLGREGRRVVRSRA